MIIVASPPEPPMTPFSRALLRLRQGALRCYEIFLYALLVSMTLLIAMPAASSAGDDDAVYCGKNQSSATVMAR
jgi:hypothetical protein